MFYKISETIKNLHDVTIEQMEKEITTKLGGGKHKAYLTEMKEKINNPATDEIKDAYPDGVVKFFSGLVAKESSGLIL